MAIASAHGDGQFDLIIKNGRIVDGTGAPWYVADVGITGERIARIGRIDETEGARVIDATGLVVAPGFVDLMGQTATPLVDDPQTAISLLAQGITTINAGEGASAAPLSDSEARQRGWRTMAEYFQLIDIRGLPLNVVQTVGHTQVRRLVLGASDRPPAPHELETMRSQVREAMEAGAVGVSTALIYPPAVYASTHEIAELAEVAGDYGGRYFTHLRNEGDRLLEAVDEALEIGRLAGTPVHIFHLKAAGRSNWPKMPLALARIRTARAEGQHVTADIYPYVHNGLQIAAFIHPRHFSAGHEQLIGRLDDEKVRQEIRDEIETLDGWENWYRHVGNDWNHVVIGHTGHSHYANQNGRTLAEIATAHHEDPWDTFFHLVRGGAFALPKSMTEANVIMAMRQPFVSFCTDAGPLVSSQLTSHPRGCGAFPRLFSRYVRDLGAVSLERAVSQCSAAAANVIFAYDRGRIAEGLAADVIVFDYEELADRATLTEPREVSVGMKYVIVNGEPTFEQGNLTTARPGRVLRGPGYDRTEAPHAVSTGPASDQLTSLDRTIREFLELHHVPGAAVAITDHGRLVFARGYGYADIATREPATPTSLFRIASISKPITSLAILQLVERGRLRLDDNVCDVLFEREELASIEGLDSRLREVTIGHLLEHRGGWDRDKSFDPMFQSVRFADQVGEAPPAAADSVIRAMLSQSLDFDPGERYAYSNFGYCLLGRVIERLSGVTYEQYVQQNVLAPLGIHSMRVGRTRREEALPTEVTYYDPGRGASVFAEDLGETVPSAYGAWYLEAMDAHGGWLASAVDLARLACSLDDPSRCPLLSAESIDAMHARPPGLAGCDEQGNARDVYYSLGWLNRDLGDGRLNHWHTGSLPGTATIIIRRHDRKNFVALFNSRISPHTSHLGRAVDGLLHQGVDAVTDWPKEDLFGQFEVQAD